ncbi:protein of unknown function [Sphingomonas laterariae]|uniref:DUF4345 domain-containing protein n=1 Tax=Edaphosphingomonas laterariae TaxID=861865 RepID=A0A239F560_9SPHN|nr:DUF4345 domain-containing protein [Sphingomonas laterariae]SNS52029.1 protein of unknown function [Sphingomonas laterariae]
MTPLAERRLLQGAVALACLIPLGIGAISVALGPAIIARGLPDSASLDSHFRYLSGIFLALGIAFASCVPAIEARGGRFRLLGAMVIAGGLARLLSLGVAGSPSTGHQIGLVMELGVVPLLMLWQRRVARRFGRA